MALDVSWGFVSPSQATLVQHLLKSLWVTPQARNWRITWHFCRSPPSWPSLTQGEAGTKQDLWHTGETSCPVLPWPKNGTGSSSGVGSLSTSLTSLVCSLWPFLQISLTPLLLFFSPLHTLHGFSPLPHLPHPHSPPPQAPLQNQKMWLQDTENDFQLSPISNHPQFPVTKMIKLKCQHLKDL